MHKYDQNCRATRKICGWNSILYAKVTVAMPEFCGPKTGRGGSVQINTSRHHFWDVVNRRYNLM